MYHCLLYLILTPLQLLTTPLHVNICQSRIRFKRTLKECRQNEETIRANAHANSLMKKDMTSFWKGIKKDNNTRVPLAPMVNYCIGDKEI